MNVLILEDDPWWTASLCALVEEQGWQAKPFASVADLLSELANGDADAILADRMLASGDREESLGFLARVRELGVGIPVIVVSALSSTHDRVSGIEAGADDYVTKPFDSRELAARLRRHLQRAGRMRGYSSIRLIGDLEVRPKERTATLNGATTQLTDRNWSVLDVLSARHGETVSRTDIWASAWPEMRHLGPQPQVIDAAISRLRKALAEIGADGFLKVVRGVGYVLKGR